MFLQSKKSFPYYRSYQEHSKNNIIENGHLQNRGVYSSRILPLGGGKRIIKFSKGKLEEMMQGQISIVLPFLPILPSHCLPFYFIPFPSLTSSFYKWKIIKAQVGVSEKNQKSQKNIHPQGQIVTFCIYSLLFYFYYLSFS